MTKRTKLKMITTVLTKKIDNTRVNLIASKAPLQ